MPMAMLTASSLTADPHTTSPSLTAEPHTANPSLTVDRLTATAALTVPPTMGNPTLSEGTENRTVATVAVGDCEVKTGDL